MAPFKSTGGLSVGKLLGVFRDRDLALNSSIRTDRFARVTSGITATGGTTTTPGNGYKYHFFTTSATPGFAVSSVTGPGEIEYIIVGGGGGAGGYQPGPTYYNGVPGSFSRLTSPNSPENKTAHGGGASTSGAGEPGGSGGGSGGEGYNPSTPAGVLSPIPAPKGGSLPFPYSITQGYPGGGPAYSGGGGAGQAGENFPSGKGGDGRTAFDQDTEVPLSYGTSGPTPGRWFAGGGGAGGGTPYIEAPGGAGGGAWGVCSPRSGESPPYGSSPGVLSDSNGTVNTGGGGGGVGTLPPASSGYGGGGAGGYLTGTMTVSAAPGAYPVTIGGGGGPPSSYGNGGSGIVIIRYSI